MEESLKQDGGECRGRMMRRRNITIKPSSLTCNPHMDVIVSLSVVVLQVHTVDAAVGSLSGGNEQLGVILALGDDFSSCGDDAILEPSNHRWR